VSPSRANIKAAEGTERAEAVPLFAQLRGGSFTLKGPGVTATPGALASGSPKKSFGDEHPGLGFGNARSQQTSHDALGDMLRGDDGWGFQTRPCHLDATIPGRAAAGWRQTWRPIDYRMAATAL